ncbi:MAG: M48 family metallopeptidase [Candidatus Baltobacteraceae bacterium]
MSTRRFLVGLGAGLTVGYATCRTIQAIGELRAPAKPVGKNAAAYGRLRRKLAVSTVVRTFAGTAAFAFGGSAQALGRITEPTWRWLRPATFAAVASLIGGLADLPIEFVEGYAVERRYGMTEQSANDWLFERLKEIAIGAALTSALAAGFGALIAKMPRRWPLAASAGAFPLFVLANVVVPIYIMPLFNTFKPLTGPLEARLRALASRYHVGDAEILSVDMSRQTTKANAYVTGIFATHRIVIGDTLLATFEGAEVEFVVAHELGHYVCGDSWRIIGVGEIVTAIVFLASNAAMSPEQRARFGEPVMLIRLYFWMTVFSQLLRPALLAYMRSREWAADRFAVATTGKPSIGAAAFERLRDQNMVEDEQPAWYECLFGSHPSLKARIAALRLQQDR